MNLYHTFADGRVERIHNRCNLRVVFMDGHVHEYPDVAYLAIGEKLSQEMGYTDPIKVNGTTVEFENMDQSITALGVRSFTLEFD